MKAYQVKVVYFKPFYCFVEVDANGQEEAGEKVLREIDECSGDFNWQNDNEGDWQGPYVKSIEPISCKLCSSQLETIYNKWDSKLKGYVCKNCKEND